MSWTFRNTKVSTSDPCTWFWGLWLVSCIWNGQWELSVPSVCWWTRCSFTPSYLHFSYSSNCYYVVALLKIGKIILRLRATCLKPCQRWVTLPTYTRAPSQHWHQLHGLGNCNDTFSNSKNLYSPQDFLRWPETGLSLSLFRFQFELCWVKNAGFKGRLSW